MDGPVWELVPVEAVTGGRRRLRLLSRLAAVAFACVTIAAAVWWFGRDGEAPPPSDAVGPSLEQQVALMWAEWQAERATSTCLAEHGYDEPPVLYETRRYAPAVAQFLGVTAGYGGPQRTLVMPALDSGPGDGWNQWHAGVSDGGCVLALGPTDASDVAAMDQAVVAASEDASFLSALAGLAWSQEHAELQLAMDVDVILADGRQALDDAAAAQATLDRLVAAGERSSTWVHLGVEAGTDAVAAYGSDGITPMVIVVEAAGAMHDFEWRYSGVDGQPLVCGDVRVLVVVPQTVYGFDDRDPTADQLWEAIVGACSS